jgi:hypothetical protein
MSRPVFDLVLAEGELDARVAEALLAATGFDVATGATRIAHGNPSFLQLVPKYAEASKSGLVIFALADTEGRSVCQLLRKVSLAPSKSFMLRFAVPMIESWLIADGDGFASWIRVPRGKIPADPDRLDHPKKEILAIVRKHSTSKVKRELLPSGDRGSSQGAGYVDSLGDFAHEKWDVEAAATRSPSLARCLGRLRETYSIMKCR